MRGGVPIGRASTAALLGGLAFAACQAPDAFYWGDGGPTSLSGTGGTTAVTGTGGVAGTSGAAGTSSVAGTTGSAGNGGTTGSAGRGGTTGGAGASGCMALAGLDSLCGATHFYLCNAGDPPPKSGCALVTQPGDS